MEHGEVLCNGPPAREHREKYSGFSKLEGSCFEGNRRGKQGPHLDGLISLTKELGLYFCGNERLLVGRRVALSSGGLESLLCLEWIGREQD